MEHAINHSLGFEIFLNWLFHTIKFYFLYYGRMEHAIHLHSVWVKICF